jgi:hypothetical protein
MSECYDFPEIVVHDPDQKCGRYRRDGVCVPLRMPENPTSRKAIDALDAYKDFKRIRAGIGGSDWTAMRLIKAEGITVEPE